MSKRLPVVIGVSGASGAALADRVIARLIAVGHPIELVATSSAHIVWRQEMDTPWADAVAGWSTSGLITEHNPNNQAATIASGSYPVHGMVIVPCSMGTVAALAAGFANNLLLRVADVTQKEGRRLVVVPRETPLSTIHLENLLRLGQRNIRIVPPMPNFYQRPTTVAEVVDFVAARALVALGIASELDADQQWNGLELD